MNAAKLIEVRRGADGKDYPATLPLPTAQLNRARALAHNLVCRDGLSIRQAQLAMREQYALRRSVGTIARDLREFECTRCEGSRRKTRRTREQPRDQAEQQHPPVQPPPEPAIPPAVLQPQPEPERKPIVFDWGGGRRGGGYLTGQVQQLADREPGGW